MYRKLVVAIVFIGIGAAIVNAEEPVPVDEAKAINPSDNDANVAQDVALMWSISEKAVTHEIYFGEDANAVAAATTADAGIYKGSQAKDKNSWTPGALEWNKTYYWRVDEVNAAAADSPWKSTVWSFTTANCLVIDDFESYTDDSPNRIYQTWWDSWGFTTPYPGNPSSGGGSSTVGYIDPPYAERAIVHGGRQSMPFAYNTGDAPHYSETERQYNSPQNWTVNGMDTLSLWVRGYPALATTVVTEPPGKITLTGSGSDIWNNSDEFTYAYKTLYGDGAIVAKVTSNGTGTNTWAKGGVMMRHSLDGGSKHATMVITGRGGNGASFQYRTATDGGSGNNDSATVVAPPYWVRIERVGDTFTGYMSADGSSWTMVGSKDVVMNYRVFIGICVTAHDPAEQRTFEFEGIKHTGSVVSVGNIINEWQEAVIDKPKYNSTESLYVALQDGAKNIAVMSNTTAVNSTDWVEVRMPLSSFTGVNAAKIRRISIGIGDRMNPVQGGTGSLFIDDIRVIKP